MKRLKEYLPSLRKKRKIREIRGRIFLSFASFWSKNLQMWKMKEVENLFV